MLFDLSGVNAMISLAAASTIQKIADSRIAIIVRFYLTKYILTIYYRSYANYAAIYILIKKYPYSAEATGD